MKSNEAKLKKEDQDNATDVLAEALSPQEKRVPQCRSLKALDGLYHCMQSLVILTYILQSRCVAPASGAVWSVPAPSSDTGTWLGLR